MAMNDGGMMIPGGMELEAEPGELIVPVADLRRILQMQEDKLAGLPSSQDVEGFDVAGVTMAEVDEALRRVGELINQAVAAAAEMLTAVIQTINDVCAPGLAAACEEIQKMMEEYADVDEPEEEDRNDGAVVVLAVWLPLAPTLYELYGQGVDHGGPGPSRLTLIRVTDDGLWRAETGTKQERRQQNEETQGLQHGRSC